MKVISSVGFPDYDKNSVHKTKVICELCNAYFKYREITLDLQ